MGAQKENNMDRKILFFIAMSLVLIACFWTSIFDTDKNIQIPNIVLIVIDTLRADHLPFYGYKKNTTPFLAELAKESMLFKNVYSTSSWTAPATASIHTSLYPFQHRVTSEYVFQQEPMMEYPHNRIPDSIKTIAETLKEVGYSTFGVSNNGHVQKEQGFDQGFDKFIYFSYPDEEGRVNEQLRKWESTIKAQEKCFIYIHYMDPHNPYHGREPWYVRQDNPLDDKIAQYDSEINYVDNKVKEMFELFEWDKNTILIVTSDHGEEFKEHGQFGHGKTLYNEVIKVPLLIYNSARSMRKGICNANVSIIDIFPTINALLEIRTDHAFEGVNLIDLFETNQENNNRYLYAYLRKVNGSGNPRDDLVVKSVIYNAVQYIEDSSGIEEFYDLSTDTSEADNIILERSETASLLKNNLEIFEEHCRKYDAGNYDLTTNDPLKKELKSLGYLQ